MTTREYIEQKLDKFDVTQNEVELIIVENSLVGDSPVDVRAAKLAICKSFGVWLQVYASISEGGVSKTWNYDAVKLFYSALCVELGIADVTKPVVKDRSNIW